VVRIDTTSMLVRRVDDSRTSSSRRHKLNMVGCAEEDRIWGCFPTFFASPPSHLQPCQPILTSSGVCLGCSGVVYEVRQVPAPDS
jgi:hypothetical protein